MLRQGFLLAVLLTLSIGSRSEGQMLIDPSGGTILFSSSLDHQDEVVSNRSLGFGTTFFNNSISTVDISTNGNINFNADKDYFNQALPDPEMVGRISPLWDAYDIKTNDGASIIEKTQPGVFYSVTWNAMEVDPGSSGRQTFQAIIFGGRNTIKGFDFNAGDIAFSYSSIGANFASNNGDDGATVGLDKGDGNAFAPMPGTPDGLLQNGVNDNLIPTNGNQFILFRPDGNGLYVASIQNIATTPAPSSLTTLLLGSIFLASSLFFVRKKRLCQPLS